MTEMSLFRWVDCCITDDNVPSTALPVEHKIAHLPHNGKTHCVHNYQILCLNHFKWVSDHDGRVQGAVKTGSNKNGVPLFLGRVFHEGSWIVGMINPRYDTCFYPYKGKSLEANKHEALVGHFYEE
ncbi:hypothetical protein Zmor_010062 [Zophobas morio]|uniref:Uncharacterized protein n=1 Tax=Zophobas morio TaxID=2755281 RepID=A0AA38IPZ2_9CUCU|nr:hypothetical protein Zmor_010062 [Zophobas morio]